MAILAIADHDTMHLDRVVVGEIRSNSVFARGKIGNCEDTILIRPHLALRRDGPFERQFD